MKRGTAAIIMLALILGIGITINTVLPKKAYTLQSYALAAADDKYLLSSFEKEWQKQKIYFLIFTEHGRIENIDQSIAALHYADDSNYRFLCLQTACALALIADETALSLGNVF